MNRKPTFMDKVGQFITGNGFYLVVLVCVAAIGISGYFLVRSVMDGVESSAVAAVGEASAEEPQEDVVASEPQTEVTYPVVLEDAAQPELPVVVDNSGTEDTAELMGPSEESQQEVSGAAEQETAAQVSSYTVPLVFTWPVNGGVIASFSVETLLYDETMLDWRTHEGIDLAASEGTRVLATAAGTVRDVYEDELMGVTVVIDHGDDLVSVYSNLAVEIPVEVGDKVYTGDIIGAVGTTAAAESGRVPHLHFAMYQKNAPVDPEAYLPE